MYTFKSRGSKFKIFYNSSSPINILYVYILYVPFPELSSSLLPAKVTTHIITAFLKSFLSPSVQVLMSTEAGIGTRHSMLLLRSPVLKL